MSRHRPGRADPRSRIAPHRPCMRTPVSQSSSKPLHRPDSPSTPAATSRHPKGTGSSSGHRSSRTGSRATSGSSAMSGASMPSATSVTPSPTSITSTTAASSAVTSRSRSGLPRSMPVRAQAAENNENNAIVTSPVAVPDDCGIESPAARSGLHGYQGFRSGSMTCAARFDSPRDRQYLCRPDPPSHKRSS